MKTTDLLCQLVKIYGIIIIYVILPGQFFVIEIHVLFEIMYKSLHLYKYTYTN